MPFTSDPFFAVQFANTVTLFAGEAINQFLNQNANELIQEMRPAASQSIGKLFRKFLNDAFTNLPTRLWLLDD